MTRATSIPDTVTIHVPLRIVKRGGRKEMQLPEGASTQRRPDDALVKALARAFRWKRLLDSGEFATIAELATREGITLCGREGRAWMACRPVKSLDFSPFSKRDPRRSDQVCPKNGRSTSMECRTLPKPGSQQVRRISAVRDRFRAFWRRGRCSAPPA